MEITSKDKSNGTKEPEQAAGKQIPELSQLSLICSALG